PNWWTLYALLPLLVLMFAVESQLVLPALGHQIAQIGIVMAFVGLLCLWTAANAAALAYEDAPGMVFMDQAADEHVSEFAGNAVDFQLAGRPEAEPQAWLAAREAKQHVGAGLGRERYN